MEKSIDKRCFVVGGLIVHLVQNKNLALCYAAIATARVRTRPVAGVVAGVDLRESFDHFLQLI